MPDSFSTPPNNQPQEATPISYDLDTLEAEIERLTRPDEMPRRVELCREALKLVERERDPQEWAWWHVELADSLQQNPLGSRADNLEEAIEHYKLALQVRTRQAAPFDWAATMNNLAIAYSDRIRGERADNLEQAIFHAKLALEVYTRQAAPFNWAMTINNLAIAYKNRIRGERADNLEETIEHYKLALQVYTRQAAPREWAITINNLGEAYRNRIRGERADNLEQAIGHYKLALQVYTRQATPFSWATMINNLAVAYLYRIRGEQADNIEEAIFHAKLALQVYTRQADPFNWAITINNLAIAYTSRIRGERADNLEEAISHYKLALTVRTRQTAPFDWAGTINNLAGAFLYRIRGERADNLEEAIFHAKLALQVYTRQAAPQEWALSCNNLALAYRNRIKGERADNLEEAISYYKLALEVRTPHSFPQDCRDTAYGLGRLLYALGRFGEARQAFVVAHEAVEVLRGEAVREASKRELVDKNADLYARLVYCCLHEAVNTESSPDDGAGTRPLAPSPTRPLSVEGIEAAFKYASAAKGRAFVDLLGSTRLDLAAAGQDDAAFTADWAQYEGLRQEIDQLRLFLSGDSLAPSPGTLTPSPSPSGRGEQEAQRTRAQVRQALDEKQEEAAGLWEEMSFRYPALTACVSVPSLSPKQARQLAAEVGATLVEYYRHASGWCAFVVTGEQIYHVDLPKVSDELLDQMKKWRKDIEFRAGRSILGLKMLDVWYEAVFAPLRPLLAEGSAVLLAPFEALRLLPLAAARHPDTQRYVAQDYQLAFVPTLTALQIAQQTKTDQKETPFEHLLSVAYPGTPPLPNVIPEAHAIASYFPQSTLLQEEHATPQAVLEQAGDKEAIHLGCHGTFSPNREQESGLMLAGGWLTVQQIVTRMHLEQSRLVTLGACDSWVLTQAIMIAGSPTVISSLWSVNDFATRALFEGFYALLIDHYPPANALGEASRLVRDCDGWQHPYYWAPFTVNGLAHGSLPKSKQKMPYSPQKLLETVRELNRQTHRMRGKEAMNEKELKQDSKIYLETIIQWHKEVADHLRPTPIDGVLVVDALNTLAQQANNVQTHQQLLTLCDNIQTLIEEIPTLRNLLVERPRHITQSQKARKILVEDSDAAANPQQPDQPYLAEVSQHLRDSYTHLHKQLPPLNSAQQQQLAPRKTSLWHKLGWRR